MSQHPSMSNTPPHAISTQSSASLLEALSKDSFPKRQRAARACNLCRKRKVRCDAVAPVCGYCAGLGVDCTYRDPGKRPNQTQGSVAEMEDRLVRMEALLSELVPVEPDGVVDGSSSKVSSVRQGKSLPLKYWEPPDVNHQSPIEIDKSTIAENESASLDADVEAVIQGISFFTFNDEMPGPPRYMGASSGLNLMNRDPATKPCLVATNIIGSCTEEKKITDDPKKPFVFPVDLPEVYDTVYTVQDYAALVSGGHGMKYNKDEEEMRKKGIDPETFLLPSWEFAEVLLEIYWCQCHMFFPFIHRPSIRSRIRDCAAGNGEPPRLLLNAMFALACRFSADPSLVAASETYTLRARSLLALVWDYGQYQSVSIIEGLLLMTMYEYGQANASRAWLYLGSAIRIAQDMGFNFYGTAKMDTSLLGLKPEAVATMRRIWSACYIMDRLVAAALGRPITINESEINTAIPLTSDEGDLDEEYQENSYGAASPSAVFPTPDSLSTAPMNRLSNESSKSDLTDPPTLFNFVQLVKLCTILGKVVRKVNSPKQDSASAAEMHPIHSALDKWSQQLPKHLQYDVIMQARTRFAPERTTEMAEENAQNDEVEKLATSPFAWFLQLVYHTTIILLHRPFLRITRPYIKFPKNTSLMICTSSATAIGHMLDTISGTELRSAPTFIIFCLYTVSTVHLNNFMFSDGLASSPTTAQGAASGVVGSEGAFENSMVNEARRRLVQMSRAFDDLRYVWPAAARIRNLLKAILGQEVSVLDRASQGGISSTVHVVNRSKDNSKSAYTPFLGETSSGDTSLPEHANSDITEADSICFLEMLLGMVGKDEARAASAADRASSSGFVSSKDTVHVRPEPQVSSSNVTLPTMSAESTYPVPSWKLSTQNAQLPSTAGIQYHNNGHDQLIQPPSVPSSHIPPFMTSVPLTPYSRPVQNDRPQPQPIYSNSHPNPTSLSTAFPQFQDHPPPNSYPPEPYPHHLQQHPYLQQQDFSTSYPYQPQVAPLTLPSLNNIARNEPDPNVRFWSHEESNPVTMAETGDALSLNPQATRRSSALPEYFPFFQ